MRAVLGESFSALVYIRRLCIRLEAIATIRPGGYLSVGRKVGWHSEKLKRRT